MPKVWAKYEYGMWYDNIGDVERADVSVLDDVISVLDGCKQCDL